MSVEFLGKIETAKATLDGCRQSIFQLRVVVQEDVHSFY